MNKVRLREKKEFLLTEGYKASKREDKQLAIDWDVTSEDGID
ncbi:MAG: hypothetical protein O8C63_03700 [Candidatus Methanoperedens sp.]|nr:hypothetical protein [Candidatus Methanoperedens sp.]